ncbi:MAG: hypothetical protein JXP34_01930 [Planctomycetes bacterium]|nr:hypothetical protein [Planctomycetota bacterium]
MGRESDKEGVRELAPGLAVAAWLIPGAGQALRGQRVKGIFLGLLIIGAFVAGTIVSETHAVSKDEHPWAFWAQIGAGLPAVAMALYDKSRGADPLPSDRIEPVPPGLDCGIMFTSIAGLLNLVVVLDVLVPGPPARRRERRKEGPA